MIRSPKSVRPWQHVLEPLLGYLSFAQHLAERPLALPRRDARVAAQGGAVTGAGRAARRRTAPPLQRLLRRGSQQGRGAKAPYHTPQQHQYYCSTATVTVDCGLYR
jgi:hypothetical protein